MRSFIYSLLTLFIAVSGCGDSQQPPPLTWGDAQTVWAESWCDYAARCAPDRFAADYGSRDVCIQDLYAENCEEYDCEALYPSGRGKVLEQCQKDMGTIPCGTPWAPDSCYAAFTKPSAGTQR